MARSTGDLDGRCLPLGMAVVRPSPWNGFRQTTTTTTTRMMYDADDNDDDDDGGDDDDDDGGGGGGDDDDDDDDDDDEARWNIAATTDARIRRGEGGGNGVA